MKTLIVRQCSLGLAAGLTFFLGCARPSAESEQPRAVATPVTPVVLVAQAAPAPAVAEPVGAPPSTDTNTPAIIERIPASPKPGGVALSPGLSEVVKLAQAGVGEEVILAYVEKYPDKFSVGADQILYLNDLGVSSTVVTSVLKHDGNGEAVAAATVQPAPAQNQPPSNFPPNQGEQPVPPLVTTSVAPPPTSSTEVSYFYDSLSPYGSWVYLSGYGWCWQPTVAVSTPAWRPYCDRGRWYWSDAGWYWNSDYSWGWAAFHYGRWYHHAGCGWVWTPGVTWAPSWVSWRQSDGYCGWAPLPPEAHFVYGSGFSYRGSHVSVGFDFGLTPFHYSFVSIGNFCDYAPYRHVVSRTTVNNVYRNTTVINNYIVGNNNTVINRGIGRETIARSSSTRIREVSVRETPLQNFAPGRGERVEKQGNQSVVFRPQLPKTPPEVKTAHFVNRGGGQSPATVGRSTTAGVGAANSGNAPATTAGHLQGGNGRAATTAATAPETRSAHVAPEDRQGRPAVNPRVTPNAITEQKAPASATVQPRVVPQQQQQAVNKPLFGDPRTTQNSTAVRSAEPAVTPTVPRVQSQQTPPRYSAPVVSAPAVPSGRTYPQNVTPAPTTPSVRSESRNSVAPTMSPRQHEQSPHNTPAPVYSAPPTSRSSGGAAVAAPQTQSRQSSGGQGGGRSESGSSRGERSERGR